MSKSALRYACDGNKDSRIERFSQLCSRTIEPGEPYLAVMGPAAMHIVESRHCVHCALTFFPEVTVAERKLPSCA